MRALVFLLFLIVSGTGFVQALDKELRSRIESSLNEVAAIDTHDHLWPFEDMPGWRKLPDGTQEMNLASIWQNSYLGWFGALPAWKPGEGIEGWWKLAKPAFADVRTMGVYRYTLPAIKDLYGVDFERITDEEVTELSGQIARNYEDQRWLYEVITEKANIEVMLNDPYWSPYDFETRYGFTAKVLRLNPVFRGFHPSEFVLSGRPESPYDYAEKEGIPVGSFDDYLAFLDSLFAKAKAAGLVGLKHTLAYQRILDFEKVEKAEAEAAFGKMRKELTAEEVKAFEDYIMWYLCELSAKHELPFQIHTGHGRIQGSNPMYLVDLIEANPKTTFILFHGGIPWVTESAAIAMRHRNVYLDSVWLPTLSPHLARRALHEWLDLIPANRIMWGADCNHAEGIYGATTVTRRVLAKVLAERIERGELPEEDAHRIGNLILRENALAVFPGLEDHLWRDRQEKMLPP